jgi:hypothetical protein
MANHPPYHLRTNKAVDRLLLLKQISASIAANVGLTEQSTYHSLGGPFMEDLQLIHRAIPSMKLVSIESNEQTHKRQERHRFTSSISVTKRTVADFLIHDYQPTGADIFWLDFTDLSLERISELQSLLSQLIPGSLMRITVAINNPLGISDLPNSIDKETISAIQNDRQSKFITSLEKYIPSRYKKNAMPKTQEEFAKLVQQTIRLAISDCMDRTNDREFVHVQTSRYSDGTPMLSVTGLICDRKSQASFCSKLKRAKLSVDRRWANIEEISLPFLSVQERLMLNQSLPHIEGDVSAGEALYEVLKYNVVDGMAKSKEALSQYAKFRHEYPSFIRLEI